LSLVIGVWEEELNPSGIYYAILGYSLKKKSTSHPNNMEMMLKISDLSPTFPI